MSKTHGRDITVDGGRFLINGEQRNLYGLFFLRLLPLLLNQSVFHVLLSFYHLLFS